MNESKPFLGDLESPLRGFGIADYVVLVLMLLVCALIGVYYGFFAGKPKTVTDYLLGGRNMQTIPVALSLVASFVSGVSLLGLPTEIYLFGIHYGYVAGTVILVALVMSTAYLPVFHDLKLNTVYEYLERRFDKHIRLFGSLLFFISAMIYLPVVIYVPALSFNLVSGINVHIITTAVCFVCIFYTSVGGLKAVVWTDVVQTLIMISAMLFVIVKGTIDVGGFDVVLSRGVEGKRIEPPDLSPDPTVRVSFLSVFVGTFFWLIQQNAVSQNLLQRYLTLPTLRSARIALVVYAAGVIFFLASGSYCGLLIYAKYHDCDPLTSKLVSAADQLMPLMIMDELEGIPGFAGVFIAGVFSSSLSTLSTGLNAMSAVLLEDFCKTILKLEMSQRQTNFFLKSVVIVLGVICVALVFIVEKLGTVMQLVMSLTSVTIGPSLGIFNMGLFFPWINSKGALVGGLGGVGFMTWIVFGAQAAIASGDLRFEKKSLSVEGCKYNFTTSSPVNSTAPLHNNEVFVLYKISFLWYTFLGSFVSTLVGLVVSFITGPTDPASIDIMLVSPVIRRFMPKKPKLKDVNMPLFKEHKISNGMHEETRLSVPCLPQ